MKADLETKMEKKVYNKNKKVKEEVNADNLL